MFKKTLKRLKERPLDILFIGEILIDGIHDKEGHVFLTFGGSPSNIALNVTQLGLQSRLCAAVGTDEHGDYLKRKLGHFQVDQSLIQTKKTKTSQVMLKDSKISPLPFFDRQADSEITYTPSLEKTISKCKVLHFSYWPLTKEPAKSTVLKTIKAAKDQGLLIAFDPNIHEALKTDETIEPTELTALLKTVDMIKPSLDDATRLFGGGYDKSEYMDFFEAYDIDLIMMTLGKEGVYVSYQKKRYLFKARVMYVIDATGAGDAFWSGFYVGLMQGKSLEETIALAQQLSYQVLQHFGAICELSLEK